MSKINNICYLDTIKNYFKAIIEIIQGNYSDKCNKNTNRII